MTDTQTSTAEPSQADLRAQLQAAAEAADRGEAESPLETTLPASADKAGEGEANRPEDRAAGEQADGNQSTDNPESSAEQTDGTQPRNEKGQFARKADGQQQEQPESNYSRAKKDAERYDRNWRKFQEERAEFERQRAEFYKSQHQPQQVQHTQQQFQQQQAPPRFSAQDYARASAQFGQMARKLMTEGDFEAAQAQLDLADQAREAANHYSQVEYQEAMQGQFNEAQGQWTRYLEEIINESPDLADPNTEMGREMTQLVNERPILLTYPEGIKDAYAIMQMRRGAAEASGLRDKLDKANKEIERLTKLASPHGPRSSVAHGKSVDMDSMSIAEQRKHLRAQAELADAAA